MTIGRPSEFSQEIASTICQRLSEGNSLRTICSDEDMPDRSTVMRWLARDENFRDQYARAREAQTDFWAEQIVEIADDSAGDVDQDGKVNGELVNRSKLRVDTRKWLMARMAPKKYGDRVVNEHIGKDGGPIAIAAEPEARDLAKALAFALRLDGK